MKSHIFKKELAQCLECSKCSINASCYYHFYYYYCYYDCSPFHRWVEHACWKCTYTHIMLSRKVMDEEKKNVGDGKGGRCLDHLVGFYITVTISSSIWNVHSGPHISCRALLPVALVFRILGRELNCFWELELSPWSQHVTPELDGHFRNCGQQAGGHLDIREDLGGMVVNVPTFFFNTYLFIWLHQILVVACRVFWCGMQTLL